MALLAFPEHLFVGPVQDRGAAPLKMAGPGEVIRADFEHDLAGPSGGSRVDRLRQREAEIPDQPEPDQLPDAHRGVAHRTGSDDAFDLFALVVPGQCRGRCRESQHGQIDRQ